MTGTTPAGTPPASDGPDGFGWLPPDLRHDQALLADAARVERAATRTFAVWLGAARRACLHAHLTAAASTPAEAAVVPPDPDAVAGTAAVWTSAVSTHLLPALERLLTGRVTALAAKDISDTEPGRTGAAFVAARCAEYLRAVSARLADIPVVGYSRILDLLRTAAASNTPLAEVPALAAAALRPAAWAGDITALARRETLAAYHAATLTGWQASSGGDSGEEPVKEWVAVLDQRTRHSHAAAHGQQVPLDAPFTVGGYPMQYPGDPSAPHAETANCRCTVREMPGGLSAAAATGPDTAIITSSRCEEPTMPPITTSAAANGTPDTSTPARPRWSGLLAPVGAPTGDGRMFADSAITARPTPLPLLWQRVTAEGHDGSVIIGRADTITVRPDGVYGEGVLFAEVAETAEARMLLDEGVIGPSVDLDDVTWTLADTDGNPLDDAEAEELFFDDEAELLQLVTRGRVSAATLVAIPAFAEARALDIVDDPPTQDPADEADEESAAAVANTVALADSDPLLAAATPGGPPRDWFNDPALPGPTPLTVDEHGRVFGHLATWNTCHIAYTQACITPPRSTSGYAFFHTGEVVCADGQRVAVGKLTVGAGHADPQAGHQAAASHYDNAATAAAVVRAGEDNHGIWIAGALVDGLDEPVVAQLRRSPLSGDWRRVGGGLELVAALAVNVPGFPIPRAATRAGLPTALVAAGCVPAHRRAAPPPVHRPSAAASRTFSPADLATAIADRLARRLADNAARARAVQRLARRIGRDPASRIAAAQARIHTVTTTTDQRGA